MNPPYGVRLGKAHELESFYPRLGDWLKRKFAGWRAYILTADARLQNDWPFALAPDPSLQRSIGMSPVRVQNREWQCQAKPQPQFGELTFNL